MHELFESPKFLIAQTQENLAEFHAISDAMFGEGCYTSFIQVDPNTGNKTFKSKLKTTIPGKARHIAATGISDIRHILDQALCASVAAVTNGNVDNVYFPFATNPNDLGGRLKSNTYQNVPNEIKSLLMSLAPYPRGNGYSGGNDFLCMLSKSAGPNKHQFSCKVIGRVAQFDMRKVNVRGLSTSECRLGGILETMSCWSAPPLPMDILITISR